MDFEPSAAARRILPAIDKFYERELLPIEPLFLEGAYGELYPELEERRRKVRELGLWAPAHPRELGGLGLDLVDFALVSEALGRTPIGHFVFGCQAPDAGNIEILHRHGSAEQKSTWLGPLVEGSVRSCFTMTEPELPGSNPVLMATTAEREGDDYLLNGRKWFATAADGAAVAVLMAVTDPAAAPHERATMFLVPTDTPGFEQVRRIEVMGHAGEGYFSHSEIVYRDCRVPRTCRLGAEGQGFAIAQERLGPGRIHHVMRWLGICARALDLMCRRATRREIAPGRPLADRELVQAWIAESRAEIDAARWATLAAAWKIERHGWRAARQEISAIKFLVAGVLQRVVDRALQVHGGLGMTSGTPLAFFYSHERAARIYDGPDEVHKLSLAKQVLRPYRPVD